MAGLEVLSWEWTSLPRCLAGIQKDSYTGSVLWRYCPLPFHHRQHGRGRGQLEHPWRRRDLCGHKPAIVDSYPKPSPRRFTDAIDASAPLPSVPGTVTRLPVSERQRQLGLCRQLEWVYPVGQPFADGTPVARAPPCLAASTASAGQECFRILEGNGTNLLLRA